MSESDATVNRGGTNPQSTIEQRIVSKIEGNLNTKPPRDADRRRIVEQRIASLKAESAAQAKIEMADGGLISMFFTRKPSATQREASIKRAHIQAELATLRLERSVSWSVLRVDIAGGFATVMSSECLAQFPLKDIGVSIALGFPDASAACTWPNSTARGWMNTRLLQALPEHVRSHVRQTHVQSLVQNRTVASDDWLYLPARAELRLRKQGWGKLDGRTGSFWLRDVGLNVGQDGQNVLSGDGSTYNPTVYDYGIQVLMSVSLSSFPSVTEILAAST